MVGVSFLGNNARYAQLSYEDATPVIEQIGHLPVTQVPATLDGFAASDFGSEVSRILRSISKRLSQPNQRFRIAIPSDWFHCYVLTVDPALDTAEKHAFLDWETSKRLGAFATWFTARYYPLGTDDESVEVLAILFPENLPEIFMEAARAARVTLQSLEPDIFASWNNVPKNFGTRYLIKFTDQTICVSQYEGQQFLGTGLFRYSRRKGLIQYLRGSVDNSRAKSFQGILKRLLKGTPPDKADIWIYGTPLPRQIRALSQSDGQYRLVAPLSEWEAAVRPEENVDRLTECQYAEAIGITRI